MVVRPTAFVYWKENEHFNIYTLIAEVLSHQELKSELIRMETKY